MNKTTKGEGAAEPRSMPNNKKKIRKKIFKLLSVVFYVGLLIFLLDTVGLAKGFGIFLLFIALISLWRCWKRRDAIILFVKSIEIMLFGKPLDRDLWKKGELKDLKKKRKLKFVWRKDKYGNKKSD